MIAGLKDLNRYTMIFVLISIPFFYMIYLPSVFYLGTYVISNIIIMLSGPFSGVDIDNNIETYHTYIKTFTAMLFSALGRLLQKKSIKTSL